MGRHDHVTCVRSDGLSAVLRPLLDDARIVAATLVDVDSGLVLDGWSDDAGVRDLELLGAGHADLVRAADALTGGTVELAVDTGDGRHHVMLAVPDPHGDRLVVAVVVAGRGWHVARARRRLRAIPIAALTDGPSLRRRPVDGAWFPAPRTAGDPTGDGITAPVRVLDPGGAAGDDASGPAGPPGRDAAPPAAMVPGPAGD